MSRRATTRSELGPEAGMTLIELLIAMVILTLLMSAVSAAVITGVKATAGSTEQLSGSHDRQLVAVYLPRDLTSASNAVSNTSGVCAGATSVLKLTWLGMPAPTGAPPVSTQVTYSYEADYVLATGPVRSGGPTWRLVRYLCATPPGQPASQLTPGGMTVAYGLQSGTAASATCASAPGSPGAACNGWAPWLTLTILDTTGASYSITGQMRSTS